jgi:D-sedoheptulose 7-phosphate isomerase
MINGRHGMNFIESYLSEVREVIERLDAAAIQKTVDCLAAVKAREGRLFFLGVGGSAANASHAANDFRKICGMECYAPSDNVAELTARANDDGWVSVFTGWLEVSRLGATDAVFILSVGGGNTEKNVSPNLVAALELARERGASILGIVGRDGGATARMADACVLVPNVNPAHVTAHSEALQAVVWHLLVSHPSLKAHPTKWESAG